MEGMLYPLSSSWFIDGEGHVGLGTTDPTNTLHVVGNNLTDGELEVASVGGTVRINQYSYGGVPSLRLHSTGAANDWVLYSSTPNEQETSVLRIYSRESSTSGTGEVQIRGVGTDTVDLSVDGDLDAAGDLSVSGTARFGDNNVQLNGEGSQMDFRDGGATRVSVRGRAGTTDIRLWDDSDNNTIRLDGVTGRTRTKILEITGGSDFCEGFRSRSAGIEPGMVMVLDALHPGHVVPSASPYDRRVAGVVSGANGVHPGIVLGQDGVLDGEVPLALSGRVYVKCSAENGPIGVGDLLTTASRAGHAMKATDHGRGVGAVIGKAMTRLEESTGLVLVLVNLQ
jgi:hypothetical protein